MRHRIQDKRFNRDANERKSLFRGLMRALTEQGEITTTRAKAKVLKRMADKAVSQAKDDSLNSRRTLHRMFGRRDIVNTLVDRVAPAMNDRNSGFTRIVSLGARRGDNTDMVKISWTNKPEKVGDLKSGKEYAPAVKAKAEKAEPKAKPEKAAAKPAKSAAKPKATKTAKAKSAK